MNEINSTQLAIALARLETKMDQVLDTVKSQSVRIDDLEDFKSKAKGVMTAGAALWTMLAFVGGILAKWYHGS